MRKKFVLFFFTLLFLSPAAYAGGGHHHSHHRPDRVVVIERDHDYGHRHHHSRDYRPRRPAPYSAFSLVLGDVGFSYGEGFRGGWGGGRDYGRQCHRGGRGRW